jgi:hypothetical protein
MEKYRFGNKKIRLGWKNTDLEIENTIKMKNHRLVKNCIALGKTLRA